MTLLTTTKVKKVSIGIYEGQNSSSSSKYVIVVMVVVWDLEGSGNFSIGLKGRKQYVAEPKHDKDCSRHVFRSNSPAKFSVAKDGQLPP